EGLDLLAGVAARAAVLARQRDLGASGAHERRVLLQELLEFHRWPGGNRQDARWPAWPAARGRCLDLAGEVTRPVPDRLPGVAVEQGTAQRPAEECVAEAFVAVDHVHHVEVTRIAERLVEAARGHRREVDERTEAVMEVTAGRTPGGRRGEPDLAADHVQAGINGIAKRGGDQRLGRAASSKIAAPGGLGRAGRPSEPVQAGPDLPNRAGRPRRG